MLWNLAPRPLLAALALSGVMGLMAAGAAAGANPRSASWEQLGGSAQHVWVNDAEHVLSPAKVSSLRLSWSIDGVDVSAPVFAGNRVLFTTSDGQLQARNAVNGKLLWSVDGIAWLWGTDNGSPAVVGKLVVAHGENQTLRAFRLTNGSPAWTEPMALPAGGPPVVQGGVIYQTEGGNGFFSGLAAYDAATGTTRWGVEWTTLDWVPPLAGPTLLGQRLFVGDWWIGGIRAFGLTGTALWQTGSLSSSDFSMPAAADGLLVYPGGSGLTALDPATGRVVWTLPEAGEVERAPAVSNGIVYTGNADGGYVHAYDLTTGSLLWESDAGLGESWSSPVVADGVVWFATEEGAPVAVAQSDGTLLWTGPKLWVGEMVNPSVAVIGGQVFVAGQHGMHVFALPR
jgi:outer membrane protein assembly factor BamB